MRLSHNRVWLAFAPYITPEIPHIETEDSRPVSTRHQIFRNVVSIVVDHQLDERTIYIYIIQFWKQPKHVYNWLCVIILCVWFVSSQFLGELSAVNSVCNLFPPLTRHNLKTYKTSETSLRLYNSTGWAADGFKQRAPDLYMR